MKKTLLTAALLLCLPPSAWARAGGGGGGGGCFPAGTPVMTPDGPVPVEELRPGDKVLSVYGGAVLASEVARVHGAENSFLRLNTAAGGVTTTPEHPFLTRTGFAEAGSLRPGEELARLDGGSLSWTPLVSTAAAGYGAVYNLGTAAPHTFVAGGFVVHNKGGFGGGRSYRSRRYGRRSSGGEIIVYAVLLVFVGVSKAMGKVRGGGTSGPRRASVPEEAAARAEAGALAALKAASRADPGADPAALRETARGIFASVQTAWQARDYSGVRGFILPHIYAKHTAQIEDMRRRREINVLEGLAVLSIRIVHAFWAADAGRRRFTALITASAKDHYVDEATGRRLHGDTGPGTFQEFWTFHWLNSKWVLGGIDQAGESRALERESRAENLDPAQAAEITVQGPGQSGPALPGAALPAAAAAGAALAGAGRPGPSPARRESRLDRAMKKLAAGAPYWDLTKMETAAGSAFVNVYKSWERCDPAGVSPDLVIPPAREVLKRQMELKRDEGVTFSFAGLSVLEAEVARLNDRPGEADDEFLARITAQARRKFTRLGVTVREEKEPSVFTEYWVMARHEGTWKMKETLTDAEGEAACAECAAGAEGRA
jgi:predicted lipid-binding transport protein (Tim44 family)